MSKVIKAIGITEHTLIGVLAENYPVERGNCFSVRGQDNNCYRIVNFVLENLQEALDNRGICWPIKIKLISDRHAVLHDERIPDSWYSSQFCEVCCPKDLLPVNQLLAHERQIARGDREEKNEGVTIRMPGLTWGSRRIPTC